MRCREYIVSAILDFLIDRLNTTELCDQLVITVNSVVRFCVHRCPVQDNHSIDTMSAQLSERRFNNSDAFGD